MWEKIKAFFENKIVKIVEGVIIALASLGLLIGGVNVDTVAEIIAIVILIPFC